MNREITLPEDLLKRAEQLAASESLPLEQFVHGSSLAFHVNTRR
jgi:hypothetical protein